MDCRVTTCREQATVLLRMALWRDDERVPANVPACRGCADRVLEAAAVGREMALTPDAAIYPRDLREARRTA